uniref:Uncharacterized protein n=1 Tax=Anguilla anguilla TaxID=7936 RepID=A0A0E9TVM6_ANGAN
MTRHAHTPFRGHMTAVSECMRVECGLNSWSLSDIDLLRSFRFN